MNKIFFSCFIKLTIILISVSFNTDAKEIFPNNIDTLKQKGVIIHVSNFSKRFAILMRDTTLSGNRFDYQWHKGTNENGRISQINYQLPAFLVDSALAIFCDSILIADPKNSNIILTGWPKKTLATLTKKNIRLYIGYVDDKGNKNVVAQFVSLKEFKRRKQIYSEELFLVVPRKELHFAVINVGHWH
jgi:hypothetical protein